MKPPAPKMLTDGVPMWKTFAAFLGPMLLSNILQSLSGTINNIYIGQMIGVGALAAVTSFFPIMFFFIAFTIGLGAGASVTLRRLVDESRKASEGRVSVRASRENAYRFMSEMAGDLPGFEEASRALFAGDRPKFENLAAPWPEDLRLQLAKLAAGGWSAE